MTPRWKINKRERDRARYWEHAEERRERQREYYAAHRDECIRRVRESERKRLVRDWNEHFNYINVCL